MRMPIINVRFLSSLSTLKKLFHLLIFLLFTAIVVQFLDTVSSDNQKTSKISNANCTPRTNIVFLKTHKCASSAVQNIFLRFGYEHNLKFVLPMKGNYLGHPAFFSHKFVPPGKYNIIAHHTRLNYPEMILAMPSETVYVTILRDPIAMFESMYGYYDLDKFYKFKFEWFNLENRTVPNISKRFANRIGTNQMFFDLGFDLSNFKKTDYRPYIEYLDSIFDLVMIEEYMDESLVLLKNLLCWSTDDVIAFKVNARIQKQSVEKLATERIKKLNQADVQLYEFFLKKFEQKMSTFENLTKEVVELRTKRKYWFSECVDTDEMKQNLKPILDSKKYIIEFKTKKNNSTCKFLVSRELELTNIVRKHQLKLYPDSVYKSYIRTSNIKRKKPKILKSFLKSTPNNRTIS